jgi:tetratricopeptide (TPR) repeat protein
MGSIGRTRIDSWKAVAAFLNRDERTVQRWEKDRGLPVHRIPGSRGRVFAYSDELTEWINRNPAETPSAPEAPERALPPVEAEALPLFPPSAAPASPVRRHAAWTALCLALLAGGVIAIRHLRPLRHPPEEAVSGSVRASTNKQAEAAFLHGRFLWGLRTPSSLQQALACFKDAERLDPHFAAAYAAEADTYALLPEFASMPPQQAFAGAKNAAQQALTLDPASAPAHRVLAFALFYGDWDIPQALAEFDKAVALDPRSAQTHHWYANALMAVAQLDKAEIEMQKARQLDPSSVSTLADEVLLDRQLGTPLDICLQRLKELSQAQPEFVLPLHYSAGFLLESGRMAEWSAQVKQIAKATQKPEDEKLAALSDRIVSDRVSAPAVLVRLCDQRSDPDILKSVSVAGMARACLLAGNQQAAADLWQQVFLQHDPEWLAFAARPMPKELVTSTKLIQLRKTVVNRITA